MNNPMKRMVSVSVALAVSVAALPIATFSEEQLSLDGEWRFSFEGGEERMMPVPSCWELQGVGTLRYGEADAKESGRYSRTFAIPSDALRRRDVRRTCDGERKGRRHVPLVVQPQ